MTLEELIKRIEKTLQMNIHHVAHKIRLDAHYVFLHANDSDGWVLGFAKRDDSYERNLV